MKLSCTFDVPLEMAGLRATTSSVFLATEMTGPKFEDRGYFVITMDNGDKVYRHDTETGGFEADGTFTAEGKWEFTTGTGKLKGIRGTGTIKNSGTAAGSEGTQEGEYSLPEAK